MPTDEEEYAFGLAQEEYLKPLLESYFDTELEETDKWDPFDFVGDKIKIELKSRRNTYNKYPTTIVGMYKIHQVKENLGDHYFVFNFTDGLYYWKYNFEDMNDFKVIYLKRNDRTGKKYQYLSIPIEKLTKIDL